MVDFLLLLDTFFDTIIFDGLDDDTLLNTILPGEFDDDTFINTMFSGERGDALLLSPFVPNPSNEGKISMKKLN
jgi:hypothetical protein